MHCLAPLLRGKHFILSGLFKNDIIREGPQSVNALKIQGKVVVLRSMFNEDFVFVLHKMSNITTFKGLMGI